MVQDTQAYTEYPIPQDRGPAEPQLDGPSGGEMDARANVIVADAGTAVKDPIGWAPSPGKQSYLDRIAPATLTANADTLIRKLADARDEIMAIRANLRATVDVIQAREAAWTLSDAYAAGKNAEIRTAWLKLQRTTDDGLRALLDAEAAFQADLRVAEAWQEKLGCQYEMAKLEIRLAIAQLNFLAGD